MTILSKGFKPDNFESHSYLKFSFANIGGLCSNFVECESFLESDSSDIVALWETNLDDLIDSGNFSVRGYLPLIQNDSVALDLSLEHSVDSYICFWLYFIHCITSFSSVDHLLSHYTQFLMLFYLT